MDESTIKQLLENHPITGQFKVQVLARNELVKIDARTIYIVNYSERGSQGTHWILIFSGTSSDIVYYFDSLGWPPLFDEFLSLLQKYEIVLFNSVKLQSDMSIKCGQYCILMAIRLARGLNFYEAKSVFNHNRIDKNDLIVSLHLKKEFAFQQ